MRLANRKIILGVTGGIAAYKSAYLTRLLVKAGADVQVVMTEAATKFVTPLTFESLTGREAAVEMFPVGRYFATHHISFAEWPDIFVIAPATADFIAQIAHGHCGTLLAAILCATRRKIILVPAMNEGMWANPAVQKNLEILRGYGYIIADVGVGEMACQSFGPGRMAEPDEIFEIVAGELEPQGPLAGKAILVTAGPCREGLDPIRFISNRSSGKMGFALARQAMHLGGNVTLITGPVALPDPLGMRVVRVETTEEMAAAVTTRFPSVDYLIMAAAPADYRPARRADHKIKKTGATLVIELEPTVDILKSVAGIRRDTQVVVGFALETENDVENARNKLNDKRLDYIIVNNPLEEGAGFETDTNRVTIISRSGDQRRIDRDDKDVVAQKIWEYLTTDGKR